MREADDLCDARLRRRRKHRITYHSAATSLITYLQKILICDIIQNKEVIQVLLGKKKKIAEYLSKKHQAQTITTFDSILSEYLSGYLKETLHKFNMKRIEIHIDWLSDYKCINIQGNVCDYFFNIQIEPASFSIAYDKDEPDDVTEFVLQDLSTFYSAIETTILKIT